MKKVKLTRIQHLKTATRGVLSFEDEVFLTLELPYINNANDISCIPTGTYLCSLRNSPKFGLVYHVKDVPNRMYILIHAGNVPPHTQGCILVGSRFGELKGYPAVLASKPALRKFNSLLNGEDFVLEVQ